MSLDRIINEAISPWMREDGPDSDIVLSTRIRLARNLKSYTFPTLISNEVAFQIIHMFESTFSGQMLNHFGNLEMLKMEDMQPIERRVLIEKHLISPDLAENSQIGACLLSENEQISIMINEEDHVRIQCLFPGFQLSEALDVANHVDDYLEQHVD